MTFASDDGTGSPGRRAQTGSWARGIALTVGVFAVLGAIAGWVWSRVVVPPEFMLYRGGYAYYASEAEFAHAFDMDLAFAITGAVAAVLGGAAVGWWSWRLGWLVTVLAAAGAIGAAVLAWQLGGVLGPASLADSASGAQRGDTFTGPVELGARSILLIWPIAALIGVMVAVWLRAPRDEIVYGRATGQWNSSADLDVQRP